ncbi:MAG: acyl-CoA dehydrogenase [Acetobacteraceae bacterium]|nr:acyl-CoA dehydrogenase [Acetobacteraceae bacterium]
MNPTPPPTPEARARRILPLLLEEADAIEATRRITPAALAALHAQRLFRTMLPRSAGGDECHPAEHIRMLIAIASADASTAWCLSQAAGCAMAAAYLPLATAQAVWGADPAAVLAWGQNQGARARVTDGGYIVSGRWTFVSGGHHATWIGGHAHIAEADGTMRLGPDGKPVERTMLIPRAAMATTDAWDVIGLRGTGSDTFAIADHFVPEAYALARDTDAERREPGPLYRFLTNHLYAAGFAAVALGTARGLLDRFIDLARDKIPTLTGRALRDSQAVQRDLAIAEAQWRAARAGLLAALDEAWNAVAAGPMPLDQRMGIRMSAAYAIREAREVADFCWREAGSTAIFAANGFERRYRDMISVTQQVQGRMIHFETAGQHLLGLSNPSTRFA